MNKSLRQAVYAIPVPADLNAGVLTACRAERVRQSAVRQRASVVRLLPAAATAAACVAVMGVALYTSGRLPEAPPHMPDPDVSAGVTTSDRTEKNTTQTTTTVSTTTDTTRDTTTTIKKTDVVDSTDNSTVASNASVSKSTTTLRSEQTTTRSTVGTDSTTVSTTTGKQSPTTTSNTVSTTEEPSPSTAASTTTTTIPSQYPSTTVNHTTRPSVGGTPTKEAGILKVSTFQEMTIAELEAYYGEKIVPTQLPEGLEMRLDPDKRLGVCRKDETLIAENRDVWSSLLTYGIVRDAEVVYDHNQLRWCDFIDGRRELLVNICSEPYPLYRLGDTIRFDDPITVGGATVMAAYFEDSADCWCWSALVEKGTVEYYVEGWNITEDEFVKMLESLIA